MKILTINCKPDFDWLTSKGLKLDVSFENTPKQVFPVIKVPSIAGDFYIPDVSKVVSTKVGYDVVMVGFNPKDYDSRLTNTGGWANPDKQPNGTRIISVRVDDLPINMYPLHEMMHTLCNIINIDFKDYVPKDFMDNTLVNGVWFPYYLNDPNINNPNSNFNQTWRNIIPFLDRLNNLNSMKIITLTRTKKTAKQTLGELRSFDGKFGCDTLELPWKDNARNISCIPTGNYICKKKWTLKFGSVYEVQDVKNRTGIYLHKGNYFFNVQGCIMLGSLPKDINGDDELDIQNSTLITNAFAKYLENKDFILVIK